MEAVSTTFGVTTLPAHIAVIMDGNRRWAEARGLPRAAGHKAGAEAVRRTVEAAAKMGVSYLTLFGFSSENWNRTQGEVGDLMGLLRLYLKSEISALKRNGVKLKVIGDLSRFDEDIVGLIRFAESETSDNSRITLVLALSYGGRQEIVAATRELARKARDGAMDPEDIDEAIFEVHLQTAGIPDPDLLIRTSGEVRISNFLLWQLAYTELVFSEVLWPEFGAEALADAINQFNRRERRYGGSV